ncbi:hypothetical protein BCIN_13g02200 [Botrytis cinerea B05.10]|uniref:Uncharacterized protein n=2 Tax=Botryotinia fuckeliana TaxID=40559 RepID=A0A384K0M9_BOTFB|nr:hypothetical protein BCIN_13g02200 [Botrytis cinerea B05.10]ATZ56380.1 hypothetical protein BCIN_13g02200 [Botrytis cinerea B05.10]EMR88283.1 hypothetical protein BcDW1_3078 [Botrytis cinerea BcDW1]
MKITIPLTSLFLGFASYATINAQTAADTISSCQAQNSDNFIFANYDGDLAVTYPHSLCFPFEIFNNPLSSALFCRDAHCSFYSDDDCTTPSDFSITPIPFIQSQGLPTKLTSSLGWKSAKCGSSLIGFTLGQ